MDGVRSFLDGILQGRHAPADGVAAGRPVSAAGGHRALLQANHRATHSSTCTVFTSPRMPPSLVSAWLPPVGYLKPLLAAWPCPGNAPKGAGAGQPGGAMPIPTPNMPSSMKGLIASLAKARSLGNPQPGYAAPKPPNTQPADAAAGAPMPGLMDAMQVCRPRHAWVHTPAHKKLVHRRIIAVTHHYSGCIY